MAARELRKEFGKTRKKFVGIKFSGCAICGGRKGLNIHHVSYRRGITMQLCSECHLRVHFGEGFKHLNPVGKEWSNELRSRFELISSINIPEEIYDRKYLGYRQLLREILGVDKKVKFSQHFRVIGKRIIER